MAATPPRPGFVSCPSRSTRFGSSFAASPAGTSIGEPPTGRLTIDAEIPLSALTNGLLRAVDPLEPFGAGNPPPLFLAGPVQIVGEPRRVGNGERHLSFRVRQQSKFLKAIAFGMADRRDELMSAGGQCCIVFTPRMNEYQGWRSIELEVRDFQPGATARLEG